MIRQFHAENFKALRDVTVDLGQLTVLVGPNGGGKTSILEGMCLLSRQLHTDSTRHGLGENTDIDVLRTIGSTQPIRLQFRLDCGTVTYSVESPEREAAPSQFFGGTPAAIHRLDGEVQIDGKPVTVELRTEGRVVRRYDDEESESPRDVLMKCITPFANALLLQLDPRQLAAPSHSNEEVPELQPSGAGLASVLSAFKLSDEERFERIEQALRSVVPSVTRLRVARRKMSMSFGGSVGDAILFDTVSGKDLPARAVSEGTLLVLGLLTILLAPTRPRLLLLDDFDRALHPLAQKELIVQLRQVLEDWPDVQIVATTHSPLLIDHLKPEEVRITSISNDGSIVVGNLQDHSKFARWKDEMTPGEFWSMVGEKWLSQAPAAAVNE